MAIDLHIHSINSDGTDTVDQIVDKALEMQLEAISITDHEYLTVPKKTDGIEIIQGIEVSANWDEIESSNIFAGIHLLIYFLEEESAVTKHLANIRNLKIERNKEIIKKLNQENIKIEESELNEFPTKVPGRPHIAKIMYKKGYVDSINEAFVKYLGNGKVGDSRIHQEPIEKLIELSKESKCLIFLAHPHTLMSNRNYSSNQKWITDDFVSYLEKLADLGIDGLETNYSSYNSETTSSLSSIAKKLDLLESGGTDYHGENKPNINIGFGYENRPLKTPYKLLFKMKEKHAGI
tara:strand:- start:1423 stop:2301 length:879 start_codon:yes stop_codon:yes gene_type:complete